MRDQLVRCGTQWHAGLYSGFSSFHLSVVVSVKSAGIVPLDAWRSISRYTRSWNRRVCSWSSSSVYSTRRLLLSVGRFCSVSSIPESTSGATFCPDTGGRPGGWSSMRPIPARGWTGCFPGAGPKWKLLPQDTLPDSAGIASSRPSRIPSPAQSAPCVRCPATNCRRSIH